MIRFRFDGEWISAESGQTVAAALANSGALIQDGGRPRLAMCGMGVCMVCAVSVNGQPGRRACLVRVEEGMEVCSQ